MRRDQLANVSYKRLQLAAMTVLDRLQRFEPQTIIGGAAWLFLAVCRRYQTDPAEALRVADRVYRNALDVAPQYPRGIDEYCQKELPS